MHHKCFHSKIVNRSFGSCGSNGNEGKNGTFKYDFEILSVVVKNNSFRTTKSCESETCQRQQNKHAQNTAQEI
jgi:hypothetical protein